MAADVTVVVCAYTEQRWDDLVRAVASVASQSTPATEVVLVVDHNPRLAARAMATFDEVTVLENQRRQGLSGARNTAIEVINSGIVVFLDDDAAARPNWLATLLGHYEDPTVLAVGGSARPVWPGRRRPALLPAAVSLGADQTGELDWVIGCTYTGQPTSTARVRNLMGCNMSFRRSVFDEIGGFAENLGRIGTTPLSGEETELCIRLQQAVPLAKIMFDPAAVVDHRVSGDRVRWSYLRRRAWAEGRSKAVVTQLVGNQDALATERAYTRHVLPAAVPRELARALRGDLSGLSGALAVFVAVACAGFGYLRGRLAGWGGLR